MKKKYNKKNQTKKAHKKKSNLINANYNIDYNRVKIIIKAIKIVYQIFGYKYITNFFDKLKDSDVRIYIN